MKKFLNFLFFKLRNLLSFELSLWRRYEHVSFHFNEINLIIQLIYWWSFTGWMSIWSRWSLLEVSCWRCTSQSSKQTSGNWLSCPNWDQYGSQKLWYSFWTCMDHVQGDLWKEFGPKVNWTICIGQFILMLWLWNH